MRQPSKRNGVSLFGVHVDSTTLEQAVDQLRRWSESSFERCRYVVTPNVDHVVMLKHDRLFQRAYRGADLVLADGWPVLWASRMLGKPLPGLAPGSDLTPGLFSAWRGPRPLTVFLLGAMPGVAEKAADEIHLRWPLVKVVDVYSPPLGFEYDEVECQNIIQRIATSAPDLLVVGLGAPKQELWVYRHRHLLTAKIALCVGATIDFLAGEKKRAPQWMRSVGLEWLHRMLSEPKRLVHRYARDAKEFPKIVWEEWKTGA